MRLGTIPLTSLATRPSDFGPFFVAIQLSLRQYIVSYLNEGKIEQVVYFSFLLYYYGSYLNEEKKEWFITAQMGCYYRKYELSEIIFQITLCVRDLSIKTSLALVDKTTLVDGRHKHGRYISASHGLQLFSSTTQYHTMYR